MTDPDIDEERFPGAFLGPNEGEGEDGSSASSSGDAESQAAPPYVGSGETSEESGAGDTGDGT